ncbi:MAG: acyl-phosphate glycerol 3-phosphate acyltransferase [Deltaproteobacteria bacterium RIFCSPLOWO2_02_FULL_53_8]|nr:MAG: acyl-phosphate glycerol 3-phosphate acyltransferase [Deltaproteobacteria bacterium RIFCSPLOWO2_02_FULL_53_8]
MTVFPPIFLVFLPIAYLIGSIPTGVIAGRIFGGVDPREGGSRNIGATNVGRTAGKAAGIITLIGDVLKGVLPTYAVWHFWHDPLLLSLVALFAFLGHIFSVFLRFRGGKGVATALGVYLVVSPIAALCSLTVFVAALLIRRYVSLGSIIAAALFPVFLTFIPGSGVYVPLGITMGVIIIVKHSDNIKRLVAGTENKLW